MSVQNVRADSSAPGFGVDRFFGQYDIVWLANSGKQPSPLSDQVKNLVSYVNGSGEWMRIRVKSEWSGFSSQLASSGASADGTIKIASRRLRAKRSPIAASSRGAGV